MIKHFRVHFDWTDEEFDRFEEIYTKHLKRHRGKFYLYGKDHLVSNLALALILEEDIKNFKIFLTCIILNGFASDLNNLYPSKTSNSVIRDIIKDLVGLYTTKELFYIEAFLCHSGMDLVAFDEYHSDFLLFNDFREYFKLVVVGSAYVRHSEKASLIRKTPGLIMSEYLKAVTLIRNTIKDERIKVLYLNRIRLFLTKV